MKFTTSNAMESMKIIVKSFYLVQDKSIIIIGDLLTFTLKFSY